MDQNKNSAPRPSWDTQGRVECIEAIMEPSAFSNEDVANFCQSFQVCLEEHHSQARR